MQRLEPGLYCNHHEAEVSFLHNFQCQLPFNNANSINTHAKHKQLLLLFFVVF